MEAAMRFRFIGQYTHGRTFIEMNGVRFDGNEPSSVPDELLTRFENNIEFEAIHPLDHDADGVKGGTVAKPRGRPKKVQVDG
jgi:hypothetical protein